jgi:ribosomal protein S18 acetylase RimI-like enzyme
MSDPYDIPHRSHIPGLRFRPFAGVSDADALHAIHLGRAARDGVDPLSSTESLGTRDEFVESLAAMTEAGGASRTILAEVDGAAVGYNRFFDWLENDGTRVWLIVGWVLPEWRGRGLGTALLHWSEGRIQELAGRGERGRTRGSRGAGEQGREEAAVAPRWEFAANASSTETEATALLLDNGYRAAYTVLEMGLDWDTFASVVETGFGEQEFALRNSVSSGGIELRPGRVEDAGLIAASIDEAYVNEYPDGRYAERFDPAAYAAELAEARYDPALWRVAWAGAEVVGQVIPRIERGRAEIYEVSVRPAWRRVGVARALLSDALMGLRAAGVEVVRLHTMAEFPTQAYRLYHSLGFRVLKSFPRYRKPGET